MIPSPSVGLACLDELDVCITNHITVLRKGNFVVPISIYSNHEGRESTKNVQRPSSHSPLFALPSSLTVTVSFCVKPTLTNYFLSLLLLLIFSSPLSFPSDRSVSH